MDRQTMFREIAEYLRQKGVRRAAVFGSFARGEETPESDIDLLVEIDGVTLFEIIDMEFELEAITKRKIDLVDYRAIKPRLKKYILANTIAIL